MFIPKYTKYKKAQKGFMPKGKSLRCNQLNYGKYGIKAVEAGKITSRQIEATRRAIMRKIKRIGKVWIRIFPDIPVSRKPAEVRMGKGKGATEFWICKIKAGRILFEIDGISLIDAKKIFYNASSKLPVLTKFVYK
ncbi:MAG: rpl16 [Burkholderiales bacterium]|jgi:large subunit ribosomal protein L16|nr:rpl16 [Burkholderiales bacterium]